MRIGRHERYSWADRRRCACVCVDGRCNCVYKRHGGLTPPALGTRTTTVHRKNNDFGDAQTHVRKSGGPQPAVVWENRPGGDGSGFLTDSRRNMLGNHTAMTEVLRTASATATNCLSAFRARMRSALHGGLTPPALVLQCERLPAKERFLRCTNVHSTKSGGRQPAVGVGKSPRRRWFRLFDRLTPEHVGKPPCHDGSFPTAGSRQPLLLHGAGRLKNNDIHDAQTHVRKSGGR
jgi:hypothetical protein